MVTNRCSRREALVRLGVGTAGALLARGNLRAAGGARRPSASTLADLSERLRTATRPGAFDVASVAIRRGVSIEGFLGAVFLAGARDVRPRHVGGKLHCVMMVESSFQVADLSSPHDGWLAALWNLDDLKRSQERDRSEGDWALPPRPDVSFPTESAARRELLAAMDAWDDERADRAIVGLLPFHDRASLFEVLWPLSARSFVSIGHKIIFGAHVERVLRRIGWEHAEDPLRSLVHGLLHVDSGGRATETFRRSTALAPSLPDGWLSGSESPARSADFLAPLRTCSSDEAQDLVIAALRDGLGPATTWDGLRLLASEACLRRPVLLPVHAVTEINALGHAFRTSRSDATKRLLLLQAAGWLPLLREALRSRVGLRMEGPGIDALGTELGGPEGPDLDSAYDDRLAGRTRVLLDRDPDAAKALGARMRQDLLSKARQSHHHKYAAAVHEESRLVHGRWRSRILAAALGYLPGADDAETDVYRRSIAALRQAGVP